MHGVISKYFYIVTSHSPVSIYRSICSCSHCFSACYRGATCSKADHPWQLYLVRGDHLRQHNLPQMVQGDQLWRGTNCGVIVPRVLRHAQNTRTQGTLIVPQWFSAPFWPLLFPNGVEPAQFVKQFIELPRCETTFLPGRSECNLFEGVPNTTVLALRIQIE